MLLIVSGEEVVHGTFEIYLGTNLPIDGCTSYAYQSYVWNLPEFEAIDIGYGGEGRQ